MRSSTSAGSEEEEALLITGGRSWTVNLNFGNACASAIETWPVEPPTCKSSINAYEGFLPEVFTYIDDLRFSQTRPVEHLDEVLCVCFVRTAKHLHPRLQSSSDLRVLAEILEERQICLHGDIMRSFVNLFTAAVLRRHLSHFHCGSCCGFCLEHSYIAV